jgi:hypothetical protein
METAVKAIAAEQITIIMLLQCMASIKCPQNTAPSVIARFDRNAAMATSLTCPPRARI